MSEAAIELCDNRLTAARLVRVPSWYYLMGIPVLALLRHAEVLTLPRALGVLAFSALYFAWGYAFNDFFDVDEDAIGRNALKSLDRKNARTLILILQTALLSASLAIGLFPQTLSVSLLNGLYSIPPIRLKRWLLPSLLANGVFFGFPFYASARMLGRADPFTALVFCLFLPLQYVHFLEHRESAGAPNGVARKAATALGFAALCYAAKLVGGNSLLIASSIYSAAGLGLIFRYESAARARVALRAASMAFGLYLTFAVILGR